MSYEALILPLAQNDIANIFDYLSQYSDQTVDNFSESFKKNVNFLEEMPRMYPISFDLPGYRRFNIDKRYCGFYKVDEKTGTVYIYRIMRSTADFKDHPMQ